MPPSTHLVTGLRQRFAVVAGSVLLHLGVFAAAGQAHAGRAASSPELTAAVLEVPAPEVERIELPESVEVAAVEPSQAATASPSSSVTRHAAVAARAPSTPRESSRASDSAAAVGTPQIVAVPPPGPLRFVMTAGAVVPGAQAHPGGGMNGEAAPREEASSDDGIVGEESVDAKPTLLSGSVPVYPPEAARDGVESDVHLEIVLDTNGAVVSARSLALVGHGLDDAAVRAVRTYRFSRGLRRGRPVRVRMAWTVMFRLD